MGLGERHELPQWPRRILGSEYLSGWSNKDVLCLRFKETGLMEWQNIMSA